MARSDPDTWRPGARDQLLAALDYEVSTLTLLAEYRAMFLSAAHWHDTGEGYGEWRADRDAYERAAQAHVAAYGDDLEHPAWNLTAADLGVQRADRDRAMAYLARVLLVLALAWLVLGLRLAPARASFVAATRPWRAADPLPHRVRAVAVVVPLGLLLATRLVQTSFLAPAHLLVTLGALVLLVVGLLLGGRRAVGPVLTVVAGVSLLRSVVALLALVGTGPGGYWFAFWTEPGRRSVYVTVAFALWAWLLVAAGWALVPVLGHRRATGAAVAGAGLALAGAGLFVAAYGLEAALTVWNDQLGLLPWGLARILGITTYLEIPVDAAWWAAAAGAVVLGLGLLLRWTPALSRRTRPASA